MGTVLGVGAVLWGAAVVELGNASKTVVELAASSTGARELSPATSPNTAKANSAPIAQRVAVPVAAGTSSTSSSGACASRAAWLVSARR